MNPLTPLELLDIIEREHGFESPSIRLALTELEELKRDMKRYFELWEQAREKWGNGLNDMEDYEFTILHNALLKVGKENDFND